MVSKKKPEFIIHVTGRTSTLPVASFIDLLRGTIQSLNRIGDSINDKKNQAFNLAIKSININSPGDIVLTIDDGTDPLFTNRVFKEMIQGINLIDKKGRMPESFDERILEGYKYALVNPLSDGIADIRYRSGRQRFQPSECLVERVRKVIDWEASKSYYSQGSLEGILLTITSDDKDKEKEKRRFKIKNSLWSRAVNCVFPSKLLSTVLTSFEKRVSVLGTIKYNQFDVPVSIDVTSIELLPMINSYRSYEDLPQIDLTHGVDIEDHIRRIRNGI